MYWTGQQIDRFYFEPASFRIARMLGHPAFPFVCPKLEIEFFHNIWNQEPFLQQAINIQKHALGPIRA